MEFVSFKIAKKLKEKGFRELCVAHYDDCLTLNCDSPLTEGRCFYLFNAQDKYKSVADAPTISQVLKWLREKHLLVIPVPSYFNAEGICTSWDCDIWADDNYENFRTDKETYEEAAIAGIEYVLDNLI